MAIQKTDCIVLKNQDIRETSLLVTFFTKDFGKVQGIIKGIRGSRGRANTSLEPFAYSRIVFYERKRGSLYTIAHCDLKDYFSKLRTSLEKIAYAYYFCELIKDFMQLHDKNVEIFNLLLDSLMYLEGDKIAPEILARIFELQLLSLSGFKPKIDYCIKCSKTVKEKAFFNSYEGGLLCPECAEGVKGAVAVTHGALAYIHTMEHKKLSELLRLQITPAIKKELALILEQFMQVHIEKQFKSTKFIRQIECVKQ